MLLSASLVPDQAVCAKVSSTTTLNLPINTVFSQMIDNFNDIHPKSKINVDCRVQLSKLNEFPACFVVRNGAGSEKACAQACRGLPVAHMGMYQ